MIPCGSLIDFLCNASSLIRWQKHPPLVAMMKWDQGLPLDALSPSTLSSILLEEEAEWQELHNKLPINICVDSVNKTPSSRVVPIRVPNWRLLYLRKSLRVIIPSFCSFLGFLIEWFSLDFFIFTLNVWCIHFKAGFTNKAKRCLVLYPLIHPPVRSFSVGRRGESSAQPQQGKQNTREIFAWRLCRRS